MHLHTTFEHQPFHTFTPQPTHLAALERLNDQHPSPLLDIRHHNGHPRINATRHVGVLRLHNTTLQILPKIHGPTQDPHTQRLAATKNLLVLLSYALNLPLLEHHAATLHTQSLDWIELLTSIFAQQLTRHLHLAPHRAYHQCHDDLPLLRGKLRIADQLRRPDRQHLLACTFDEFSLDHPLNQVFRHVVERLYFLTQSPRNRTLLASLRDALDPVTLRIHLPFSETDPSRLLNRLNARYRPLLDLARLFLQGNTPQLSHGRLDCFNFLFDMNALFESFIARFLQKHQRTILQNTPFENASIRIQHPRKYLLHEPAANRDHFLLKPDITLRQGKRISLIIDTKYKRLDPSQPRYGIAPADIYQMLAYALRYRCHHILLLYPQTADTPNPLHKSFTLDHPHITITAATINVCQDLTTSSTRQNLASALQASLKIFTDSPTSESSPANL